MLPMSTLPTATASRQAGGTCRSTKFSRFCPTSGLTATLPLRSCPSRIRIRPPPKRFGSCGLIWWTRWPHRPEVAGGRRPQVGPWRRNNMWSQNYTPLAGSLGWSAFAASLPMVVLFYLLAVRRLAPWKSAFGSPAPAGLNVTPGSGSLGWSAFAASLPMVVLFYLLAVRRLAAWKSALASLAAAVLLAAFVYRMPTGPIQIGRAHV